MRFHERVRAKSNGLLCVVACALIVGCVSARQESEPSPTLGSNSAPGVLATGAGAQKQSSIAQSDGQQKSVFVDRMAQLEKPSIASLAPRSSEGDVGSKLSASQDMGSISSVQLLMRSEKWSELLLETNESWNECLGHRLQFSESCRDIGRARSLAHVRMGHEQVAWRNFDLLVDRGQHSSDALFFAALHLEAGSAELCSELATVGLSWEPVSSRLELSVLNAKCLRLAGRTNDARAFLYRSLNEYPRESSLLVESAFVSMSENNLTEGCDILERLFLKETRQLAVFYNWGQCLVRRRDSAGAASVLERGRREWPSERAWIILSGEVALLEGRVEEARQLGLDYLASSESSDLFRAQAEKLSRVVIGEK